MPDATISAAGLRIMKLLVGNPPQTVADLIRATNVTRTAITEQLNELVAAGFVERATERLSSRGRPRHLYNATQAALVLLFASNQCLVVPAIWRAIGEVGGDELTDKVLKGVSRALAEHYNGKIAAKKPQERLRHFIDLLTAEGALIEAVEDDQGQLVLYKRSCPFISMVDDRRNVCHIDQEVLSAVVGRPVRRTACRHEGAPCCTFEIADA
jgi:DeoR family transcriptional regulator, suf operon transcriptional repressor